MKIFTSNYRGRILSFTPNETPDGWIARLHIAEICDEETHDTEHFPDDGTPHASQEEAAAVAETYGKMVIDEASENNC